MKGLKFLIFLGILVVLIVLFMLPFYYSDIGTLWEDLNKGTKTLSSVFEDLKEHVKYVNYWSVLGFAFLAAGILNMHAIIDLMALNKLNKYYSGKFVTDGLLWLSKRLLSLVFTLLFFIFISNLTVIFFSTQKIVSKLENLDDRKYTVLLLGTNKLLKDGVSENVYFTARIDAVVELYKAGYVARILVSGDNSTENYNEPRDMMQSLIKKGVPQNMIKLDFAGLRTLDSIVRSKQAFGLENILIVSQDFHLQRALFLSWYFNVSARGYEADGNMNMAMFLRERLAIPKMLLDVMVLNTQPKYGSVEKRRDLTFEQGDVMLIILIGMYLAMTAWVSRDAFNFGK